MDSELRLCQSARRRVRQSFNSIEWIQFGVNRYYPFTPVLSIPLNGFRRAVYAGAYFMPRLSIPLNGFFVRRAPPVYSTSSPFNSIEWIHALDIVYAMA